MLVSLTDHFLDPAISHISESKEYFLYVNVRMVGPFREEILKLPKSRTEKIKYI